MKMQKKLNIVLVILTLILVSLVSFGGIYYRNKGKMDNRIPDYQLGTDLKGYRQVTLEVAEEEDSDESEKSDETENAEEEEETENSEEKQEDSNEESKEEKPEINKEDYKKTASIYKQRLKDLKVDNFSVSCDEETGRIVITIPENDQTDVILSDLSQKGKFTIKDSKTEEELLTNADVRTVKVGKNVSATGSSTTYMSIYFNTKGTNKFKNVTQTYQNNVEEESKNEASNEENNEEENEEENVENNEENEEVENEEENETEDTSEDEENKDSEGKQITLNIDDVTMMTTSFDEIIDNGVLSLTLGTSTDESNDELYSAYNLAAIIENEELPIKYEIKGNTYVSSTIEEKDIKALVYVEIGIALAIILLMIIKYRLKGMLTGVLFVGYTAVLLIVLRFTNVTLSVLGILAIGLCYLLNSIYNYIKLDKLKEDGLTEKEKQKAMKEILMKYTMIAIPQLIIAIVFCFTQWAQLLSFGMTMFWGIIISLLYNVLLNKILD